jgi:hypothetical protein
MDLDKGRKRYGFPKVLASLPQRKSIPQNNFCPYLREQSIIYGFPKVLASLPQRKSFHKTIFVLILEQFIIYSRTYHT